MKKRPNILFLMSDEHRADVVGYEGNTIVRTPFLDDLASSGAVFQNAYTPSPICVPARQCLMAGQLPTTCNCRVYGDDLAPNYLTWARLFSQYGYETVCCGKLHHMGPDQMQGWRRRISFDDVHVEARYVGGLRKEENEHLPRNDGKWSDVKEILRAGIGKSPHAVSDEFSVAAACSFIEEYFASAFYDKEQSAPLLLKVSLLSPHYPYFCDEEKFTYYLNRVAPFVDEEVFDHPFLSQHQVRVGEDVSERELRRATAAYYGMIQTIDTQYGRVLDTLRHVGQNLDDWIIIYTSDHGEMLGEHGIWEKQKFFEASARVPLLIRAPKYFEGGRVVEENVNFCDLFATLCDLANLPIPDSLDSRSLVPLLNGDASNWDNETISQYGAMNLMIKRDNLKYQCYGSEMPEVLFDLQVDPKERINCIHEEKYSVVLHNFRRRAAELGYTLQ